MTPREELVETIVGHWCGPRIREGAESLLDALLAHRDLLLEALGGTRIAGIDAIVFDSDEAWWRFPVSEEAQK